MKPLKVLKFAWICEAIYLVLFSSIIVFLPDKAKIWIDMLGVLIGIVSLQGICAFGGKPLKMKLENSSKMMHNIEGTDDV